MRSNPRRPPLDMSRYSFSFEASGASSSSTLMPPTLTDPVSRKSSLCANAGAAKKRLAISRASSFLRMLSPLADQVLAAVGRRVGAVDRVVAIQAGAGDEAGAWRRVGRAVGQDPGLVLAVVRRRVAALHVAV